MPNAQTCAVLELDLGEQLEELGLLRVRAREAGLDEADAEPVERVDDAHLLGRRERHALALHAVAKGRVVELYLGHVMPFGFREIERVCARASAARPRGAKPPRRVLIRSIAPDESSISR